MVIQAEEEARRRWPSPGLAEKQAALSLLRRSKPQSRLHNFSLPSLSWGNQKLLRCVNYSRRSMDDELQRARLCSSSSSPNELQPQPLQPLRFPGQTRCVEEEVKRSNPLGASDYKPWNLRSRRSSRNVSAEIVRNRNPSSASSQSPSPSHSPLEKEKASSPLNLVTRLEGLEMKEKEGRRKFSIALSKEEIEEDFLVAKGTKPPRRPKKRAKYLQGQLDTLFPGVLLSEVAPDLYKIEIEN